MTVPVLSSNRTLALVQLIAALRKANKKKELAELKLAYDQHIEKYGENLSESNKQTFIKLYREKLRALPISVQKSHSSSFVSVGKEVGGGGFGIVHPFRYVGESAKLKSLSDKAEGFLVVKDCKLSKDIEKTTKEKDILSFLDRESIAAYEREMQVISFLQLNPADIQQPLYAQGLVVELEKGKKRIALEYIFHEKSSEGLKTKTLEEHLKGLCCSVTDWVQKDKHITEKQALPAQLAEFARGIHASQSQLHAQGVLHLDTALRNFMLAQPLATAADSPSSIKIIDFGLSQILSAEKESVKIRYASKAERPRIPSLRYNNAGAIPVEVKDQSFELTLDIHTDLFSKKVTLMEMGCALIGIDEIALTSKDIVERIKKDREDEQKQKDGEDEQKQKDGEDKQPKPRRPEYMYRKEMSDEGALAHFLQNLKKFINDEMGNNDFRVLLLNNFIRAFEEYLTSMPDKSLSYDQVREQDDQLFRKALMAYQNILAEEQLKQAQSIAETRAPHFASKPVPVVGGDSYGAEEVEDESDAETASATGDAVYEAELEESDTEDDLASTDTPSEEDEGYEHIETEEHEKVPQPASEDSSTLTALKKLTHGKDTVSSIKSSLANPAKEELKETKKVSSPSVTSEPAKEEAPEKKKQSSKEVSSTPSISPRHNK